MTASAASSSSGTTTTGGGGLCFFILCFLLTICSRRAQTQIFNNESGGGGGGGGGGSGGEGGSDYLSDYPPFYRADNGQDTNNHHPEIVRQQTGTDMILKCNTTSCLYHKHKLLWEFKACQPDFKKIACESLYDGGTDDNNNASWDRLEHHRIIKKKCSFSLELRNPGENQSGLYRCVEDDKIIKTYEVEVINTVNRYSGQPPELLDVNPSNITIAQNMQIIIQCKVYSKQPPVILWFKQSDSTNYDIQYSDKFYSRMNTSAQVYAVPHELNVYLSKLNIYHAREMDSGVYVCVAMTESGKDYKDALVKVVAVGNYWEPPHSSFFLLFLIPVVFALIPITVWLCYYRKKKKIARKTFTPIYNNQNRHLIRPVLSSSNRIVLNNNNSTLV